MTTLKYWYLEGYAGPRRALQRIRLFRFPFRVGREAGLPLALDSDGISREHAEFEDGGDHLLLRDLDSTNGTFVNREPIHRRVRVESGDIIHFGGEEFRLALEEKAARSNRETTREGLSRLSEHLPGGGRAMQQLLVDNLAGVAFQPIVRCSDGGTHAWEMLGRGRHPELSEAPGELFRIAESMGLEVHFSELLRRIGVEAAYGVHPDGLYFTNIHPDELVDTTRLLESMDELRHGYPDLKLVMEIHEAAVVDRPKLQRLRDHLRELDIDIAYDDFGRGQARIVELADVPPDYIKLDMELVKDIDLGSSAKQQMVEMFAGYARDNGIEVIAEGVNTDGEIAFCAGLGIDLVQGFRFGRPGDLQKPE